jgi:superfamily II DNA/RNA helicase
MDIPNLEHVFLYSPPDSPTQYIHLSGRTGRLGKKGVVICLLHTKEIGALKRLTPLFNSLVVTQIELVDHPAPIKPSTDEDLDHGPEKLNEQQAELLRIRSAEERAQRAAAAKAAAIKRGATKKQKKKKKNHVPVFLQRAFRPPSPRPW